MLNSANHVAVLIRKPGSGSVVVVEAMKALLVKIVNREIVPFDYAQGENGNS